MKFPWVKRKKPEPPVSGAYMRKLITLAAQRRKEAKQMRRGRDILLRVVKTLIEEKP